MEIVSVTEENLSVYLNLAQCYEGEFSKLTCKKPNAEGLFELDTQLGDDVKGFLLMVDGSPAALAAIALKQNNGYEVCEFYVVPYFRKKSVGMMFAHLIWRMFPGDWETKQIVSAQYASEFWRKTISSFDQTVYEEDYYEDLYWGIVTRQRFHVNLAV